MIARELMQRDVLKIPRDLSVSDLCDVFQQAHVHGAPVVDEAGKLVGFVSQEDILFGSMGRPAAPKARSRAGSGAKGKSRTAKPDLVPRVRDIMTAPAVSAAESTEVVDLCRIMWKLKIHHVPIVRGSKVTGVVSTMDLCRAISLGTIRA